MAFKYENVVPWGRNFDEYRRMFDLQPADLSKRIIGCGDGPASFNTIANQRGGHVTSVDPIYVLTKAEIEKRIEETYQTVISQTEQNQEKFRWDQIRSVAELGQIRMEAMRVFLASYDAGKANNVYIPGTLPVLPFQDDTFELALCSHFLFLYSDHLSSIFHVEAIQEMLRIAQEVRIFPLLDVNAQRSIHLDSVLTAFQDKSLEIRKVDYEFQIGGNEVLIVKNR
ncbi:MAG: SAM-dependent methyltransferase [Chloroflexi bacterium]|nr:SAM-dependent methyltransferase [Chloroflexota bacterium]